MFQNILNRITDFILWKDKLKSNIEFKPHNLIKDEYPQHNDIIFCRNVIIYFDDNDKDNDNDNDKEKVLKNLVSALKPDGYLFLGHSETPYCCKNIMKPVFEYGAVCYRKMVK